MDSLITAAARALAAGDPLGALKRVALREDPPALALRGVAMAQLGDFARAKALMRSASRAFGGAEPLARARCIVAEAEIALASRDLSWRVQALEAAQATLDSHGDRANAAHARYLTIRRLLLLGRLNEAARALAALDPLHAPPALRAIHELIAAGIAVRCDRATQARTALARGAHAARLARIPALIAETEHASLALQRPAGRLRTREGERLVRLDEVEALLASRTLVVDARQYIVRDGRSEVALARRPVLFVLARTLAEAWPHDASRQTLAVRAFRAKRVDESYRARLRVEIGRLRRALHAVAHVAATPEGFALSPHRARDVAVLARPVEDDHADVLALLADGESWSSSALALALGASQRTLQRALESLATAGKVHAYGRGRARRWMSPPPGFATPLLLPATLADD